MIRILCIKGIKISWTRPECQKSKFFLPFRVDWLTLTTVSISGGNNSIINSQSLIRKYVSNLTILMLQNKNLTWDGF